MPAAEPGRLAEDLSNLRDGLLHWFYGQADRKRAILFANLLADLLRDAAEDSILTEECRALIAEVRGDLPKAIRHREKELRLIRRLQELSLGRPGEEFVLHRYGFDELSDRLDLLATLQHAVGKRDKAIALLEESQRLCAAHGFPFDGADLLEEYSQPPTRKKRA